MHKSRPPLLQDVERIQKNHQSDTNLSEDEVKVLREASKTGDAEKVHEVEQLFEDDSPYDVVRAAVRNTDGEEVANTLRAWILGFLLRHTLSWHQHVLEYALASHLHTHSGDLVGCLSRRLSLGHG
ncbi:hypothetical protein LTR62_002964 [Meristemomyces frigidus]|uniref:Uncharacterized protein n=1 Tax=Meristemomyces frigidus TaxID=1508187 RepID=A0AAN7TQ41_9PEZI|nr:hypothetical protein LTR62_002964 [Meristemomyces frigidus]